MFSRSTVQSPAVLKKALSQADGSALISDGARALNRIIAAIEFDNIAELRANDAVGIKTAVVAGVGVYRFSASGSLDDDVDSIIDAAGQQWLITSKTAQTGMFNIPPGFSALPFDKYYVDGVGRASVDTDVYQLWLDNEVQGIVSYYVDYENGSDANSGANPTQALKTIKAAAQKADVGKILLLDGVHYDGLDGFKPTRDIEIKSWTGAEVIMRMGEHPIEANFTATPENQHVFEASISRTVYDVFDGNLKNAAGDYVALSKQTSEANVRANRGSWWYDTGANILYVRMFALDTPPDANTVILTSAQNQILDNQAIYLENIRIEGGSNSFHALNVSAAPRLYMKNCKCFYPLGFCIDSDGAKTYLENCEFAWAPFDNLNYHRANSTECVAVEINCISREAGTRVSSGDENVNASSAHEAATVARINGEYYNTYGPVIIDTGTSKVLNVGVSVNNSTAPTASQNKAFTTGESGMSSVMYNHFCRSKNCVTDLDNAGVGGLYHSESQGDKVIAGSIKKYVPSSN